MIEMDCGDPITRGDGVEVDDKGRHRSWIARRQDLQVGLIGLRRETLLAEHAEQPEYKVLRADFSTHAKQAEPMGHLVPVLDHQLDADLREERSKGVRIED